MDKKTKILIALVIILVIFLLLCWVVYRNTNKDKFAQVDSNLIVYPFNTLIDSNSNLRSDPTSALIASPNSTNYFLPVFGNSLVDLRYKTNSPCIIELLFDYQNDGILLNFVTSIDNPNTLYHSPLLYVKQNKLIMGIYDTYASRNKNIEISINPGINYVLLGIDYNNGSTIISATSNIDNQSYTENTSINNLIFPEYNYGGKAYIMMGGNMKDYWNIQDGGFTGTIYGINVWQRPSINYADSTELYNRYLSIIAPTPTSTMAIPTTTTQLITNIDNNNIIYNLSNIFSVSSSGITSINPNFIPLSASPNNTNYFLNLSGNNKVDLQYNFRASCIIELLFDYQNDGIIFSLLSNYYNINDGYGYYNPFLYVKNNKMIMLVYSIVNGKNYTTQININKGINYILITIDSSDPSGIVNFKIQSSNDTNYINNVAFGFSFVNKYLMMGGNMQDKWNIINTGFTGTIYGLNIWTPNSINFGSPTTLYNSYLSMMPPTSTAVVPTSTAVIPTSTAVVPTSTAVVPTSTVYVPTSTAVIPTSTAVIPTSTAVVPTSTAVVPTSTAVAQANTNSGSNSSTTASLTTSANETDSVPTATSKQIVDLLNKGVNILTPNGIIKSNYSRGPSTSLIQTSFTGTSNLYSPFLYYNKATSEKFIGY